MCDSIHGTENHTRETLDKLQVKIPIHRHPSRDDKNHSGEVSQSVNQSKRKNKTKANVTPKLYLPD